jgi:sulfate/thiosulfate transport system substrate-binding protein
MKSFLKLSAFVTILAALILSGTGAARTNAQSGTPAATQAATAAGTAAATVAATPFPTVKDGLPAEATVTLAGFAVPREAYAEIIPLFVKYWEEKTGQKVTFKESYQASGAQSRAVAGGFKADVVALSLESDVTRIANAKLITHEWKKTPYNGTVSASVAVLTVRKGNPKGIKDWADLIKPGVEIITPNPATSGGAQWNLLAAYGAAKRGKVAGIEKSDEAAFKFLGDVIKNITVLDKDGRESFLTFQKGVGDVAITYENEAYAGIAAGDTSFEIIYPSSTILIENPGTYVDVYATENKSLPAARAFVDYLVTAEAQAVFAKKGFRPLLPDLLKEPDNAKKFPPITDLFTIEEFGGWPKVSKELFGETGTISKLLTDTKGQ